MATNKLITADLSAAIAEKRFPGITIWNRLEGRPRADKFDRALRAEVRDALWMLTRQWQMGEFEGDDAGSPVFAKVRVETTRLRKYQPVNGPVEDFNESIPLEAHVERMPVPFNLAGYEMLLDIRLLAGRHWLKLIRPIATAAVGQFINNYSIHNPNPSDPNDAPAVAHVEAWANFAAAQGRMDGIQLYLHLRDGGRASDGIPALSGLETPSDQVAERFVAWFEKLFYQPVTPQATAWVPNRLEYQFATSTPHGQAEKVFAAEEYFHGHLDWYNFDIDPSRSVLGEPSETPPVPAAKTLTMLPTQATFNGMPNARWWTFEDGRTNFGDVKPDTTDLAKLLLIEFGLVFANDWFLIPFTVPAGSVANIRGMAVTNVFGERIWIEGAGSGDDDDWQRWAMFLLSIKGKGHEPADLSLMIPPVAQKVLEGPALEDIMLARDEMANMVWGIERTITLPSGNPKRGSEAAQETRGFFERRLGAPPQPVPPAPGAKVRYKVMTTVPENFIPLIPVHVPNDNRETQLQRAAMLRLTDPANPVPIEPRTSLLRVGLDEPTPVAYFIHEEEVPRAGVQVTQRFQRTRWRDGRAWLWLGVRKQTGRGESSSGLAFDQITDIPQS